MILSSIILTQKLKNYSMNKSRWCREMLHHLFFPTLHSKFISSSEKKFRLRSGEISDIYKIIFTKFVNFENNAYLCTRNW